MGGWVTALNVLVAILADSSYAMFVGALLARWWLIRAGPLTHQPASDAITISGLRLGRLVMICLTVLIVSHLARPWFVASSMSGSTLFAETFALIPTILTSTRQGGLWYANSLALGTLLGRRLFGGERIVTGALWIEVAGLCMLAATKAASSHASEDGDFTLAEISQFLHNIATSVWAGAVLIAGLVVVPRLAVLDDASILWNYGGRLSKTVTKALGILVISGLYASWSDMHGAVSSLWSSPWGKTLVTKLAFVATAVLLGSLTRFRCLGRPATSQRATTMTKLLRSEAAVMMGVLCISGLLANTNPSG